mmetsp:Transcript_42479/g.98432  ORF Transcript_42479/g.98432 Transcript_42479/m.98432 type:complete len:266 (+) Transcript_42479:47-844(+)
MAWRLSEAQEGLRVFGFLHGQDLLQPVARVCVAWWMLRDVKELWAPLCRRDFSAVAAAFAAHPHWAPADSQWYDCYCRLLRARISNGIMCPGCGSDMVPDLLNLFKHLAASACEQSAAEGAFGGSRASIPMKATAGKIEDIYREDARSALPGRVFGWIVAGTCTEYMSTRGRTDPARDEAEDLDLWLEEFLEYFAELLAGEDFNGDAARLTRSLRPWSTAATHNLIRLLYDPRTTCTCVVEQPPDVAIMWSSEEQAGDQTRQREL